MATVTIQVKGMPQLLSNLRSIPQASNAVIRQALVAAQRPIAKAARKNLNFWLKRSTSDRREGGREPGTLKRAAAGSNIYKIKRYASGTLVAVIGPSKFAPHAHLLEFGSFRQPPRPWFRPAWDATKGIAKAIFRERVAAGIAREARRKKK